MRAKRNDLTRMIFVEEIAKRRNSFYAIIFTAARNIVCVYVSLLCYTHDGRRTTEVSHDQFILLTSIFLEFLVSAN